MLPPLRVSSIFTVADDSRFEVHVIVCASPIVQLALAAGDVTVTDGLPMVNPALVATAGTPPFALTRTTAALVAGPVAVHARLPPVAAEASVVQLAPPSPLSSTRTVVPAGRLLEDQGIVRAVPIAQFAPAAGDVTASAGVTIWNAGPTPPAGTAPVDVTRTRAAAVSGPDAVQTKLPVFGAAACRIVNVAPSSRLSSIVTGSTSGRLCVQVTVTGVPAYATVPVAGPVTVSDGVVIANAPLVPLATTGSVTVTRATAAAVSGPVTTQAKLPVFGTAAASVSNVPPPSRLTSTTTDAAGTFVDHVIGAVMPA